MPRSRTILDDLPLRRRVLAMGALAAAKGLERLTRSKRAGIGDVLVPFANLGDQLRMMNVLSRFELHDRFDVLCNAGTQAAFTLYPSVRHVESYANQGAGVLAFAAAGVFAPSAPYARAFVPHPFITQPLAMAAARRAAAFTFYSTSRLQDRSPGAIPLDRSSYRAAYENFFSHALGAKPVHDRPQLAPELSRAVTATEPRILVHMMTSAASRAMDPSFWNALLDRLLPLGLKITMLGGRSEEARMRAACGPRAVDYACGNSLPAVARMLAAARLFIGVDSSMMNLADAVGTPSVVLYTRTAPQTHGPFYTVYRAVVPETGYAPAGVETFGAWGGAAATGPIPVDAVMAAVNELLR